jgi:hypothetical protein
MKPIELFVEPLSRAVLKGVTDPRDEQMRTRVDLCVLPWFEDERPFGGLAGFLDWRTGGSLSRLARTAWCSGHVDERVLLPGGKAIPAERVLLAGWGESNQMQFGLAQRVESTVAAIERLIPTSVLLAMPGWIRERGTIEAVFSALIALLREHGHLPPSAPGGVGDDGAGAHPDREPVVSHLSPVQEAGGRPLWWVVADCEHVPRLRRLLQGPPRAAGQ